VLKLNDKVQVKVLEVDTARKRIALSIKQTQANAPKIEKPKVKSQHTREAERTEMNMNDALSMLKKKFW
jgi:uncharacterized protein